MSAHVLHEFPESLSQLFCGERTRRVILKWWLLDEKAYNKMANHGLGVLLDRAQQVGQHVTAHLN